VRLEVLDRGTGLPQKESDPPQRGLGLEIARSFAAASGGRIELVNRPDGGAIASLELPAAMLPAIAEP
jgi:two-component system sensor histidine kinase CreC